MFDADRLHCFVESMSKRAIFPSCITPPYQRTFFKLLRMRALTESVRMMSPRALMHIPVQA